MSDIAFSSYLMLITKINKKKHFQEFLKNISVSKIASFGLKLGKGTPLPNLQPLNFCSLIGMLQFNLL